MARMNWNRRAKVYDGVHWQADDSSEKPEVKKRKKKHKQVKANQSKRGPSFQPKTTTGINFVDLSSLNFEALPWGNFTEKDMEVLRAFNESLK